MKKTFSEVASAAFVLLSLAVAGCSGVEYPDTVPAEGTVLYKGKPVVGANVSFHSEGAPRAAYAVTDDQGKFVLSTFGSRDGAIPGDHVVTVSKPGQQPAAGSSTQPPKPEDLMKMMQEANKKKPDNTLPTKYASPGTSPLKFTVVKDAPNNFNLELTD